MRSNLSAKHFKAPKSSEEWTHLFFDACQSGNLAVVKKLCSPEFKAIADIHAENDSGFHLAFVNGHLEVVKFLTTSKELLAAGHTFVDIHANGEESFRWACGNGHLDIIKFLTTSPELIKAAHSLADIHYQHEYGFRVACLNGHLDIVKFLTTSPELLEAGHTFVDIHAENELGFRWACGDGYLEIVKFLTTSPEVLEAGHTFVDIHANDEDGFLWACEYGHWHVIQFLIFELQIERTPMINAIIKDYPQAQELFRVREEQERLQEIMESNQSFQNSLLRLAVVLNQTAERHTRTPLKENDLHPCERKSAMFTIRRL